jgi:hypothetical protein
LDDAVPFNDPRLADGSRFHAALGTPPSPGTCISLRVPAGRSFSVEDCVASGSLTPGAAQFLSRMIEAKLAFLIVVELAQALAAAFRQGVGEISRPLVLWGLPESGWCVRVRTRRYSLPNSDNPNLHPMMK